MVQHWGSMQMRFSARILIATQKWGHNPLDWGLPGTAARKFIPWLLSQCERQVCLWSTNGASLDFWKSPLFKKGHNRLFLNKSSKFSGIVNISKIGSMMSVTMFQTSLFMENQWCSFCISCNEKASFRQGHKISRSSQIPVKCPVIVIGMLVELWTLRF